MQIGLYFHIPFCASKCYYCDFLSFPKKEEQTRYIEALIKEIENTSSQLPLGTSVKSIFIGGGTPTVLPPFLLDRLLKAIVTHFDLLPECEWSIEANPGTLDLEKIEVMCQYPINRISLGLQSTHDHLLKAIGRGHRFEQWKESIEQIQKYTTWQINTDLMLALPGQTLDEFKQTLQIVASYQLDHISVYALIIEEGTVFGKWYEEGKMQEVSEELDRAMYHEAQAFLQTQGYEQYEISNWAKPGKRCQHNLMYWKCEPYIGMGLGAHSLYGGKRYYNEERLENYIKAAGDLEQIRYDEEILTPKALMEEYIFLGLRLNEGINCECFEKQFGISIWTLYKEIIQKWLDLDAMRYDDNRLYLSPYGFDVCNEIMASFI